MSAVRRLFVEKKPAYAVAARQLESELRHYLGIQGLEGVRILIRYDMEHVSDAVYAKALRTVFSEAPVDQVYEEDFYYEGETFSVEYLPGQFDQRADSAEQCLKLLDENANPLIRTATTYVIEGQISAQELDAIKEHCINPVDSRECAKGKPESLQMNYAKPEKVPVITGFTQMDEEPLLALYQSLQLAMTFADFRWIQDYFTTEEKRDPSLTEIRVLDTYWSDHCRHTTFSTELTKVTIPEGDFAEPIRNSFAKYQDNFKVLYRDRDDKFVCLMDIALAAAKLLKREGKLTDQEESDEINACSIVVPIDVDGKSEEWLINFKNETHNHPTEIEPFGGAATCLGGAIRDPLSGRTYVYQAMRVTGAADPTKSVQETMEGKLPQKKIVREAAHGYSSYGNQIGLATGYVKEIYHPDYVAKRMEIGAVMAAAPRRAVQRLNSDPGDRIILLGGRTGRDGIGGATGSSKAHNTESTSECGAEVQKGNAPTERKLQRLFRREEVSYLIKKCNDFGAGGVSVAIGELARGLEINLDLVPKKYEGLNGTELAISESQERMAVVVAPEDVDRFLAYAAEENLEAVEVAVVTESPRLVLFWRGDKIVDLSRDFLDTNGAHQETEVEILLPDGEQNYIQQIANDNVKEALASGDLKRAWLANLSDLNVASQKGLVERFDSSIGANSVLMPYGGKYQLTETQAMVAKVPVPGKKSKAVTMMSYGYDPYLSSWSPYHGAQYAVLESVARIVAAGGDYRKIHFTFQEYFGRMNENPKRWSQPVAALLGAYEAQLSWGLASIGGKDSMSGSFNEIDVPATLVSFAVDVASQEQIISPELKKAGNRILRLSMRRDAYDLPDYENLHALYTAVAQMSQQGMIQSAYALDAHGLAAAFSKMAFGNLLGVAISDELSQEELFSFGIGDLLLEISTAQEREVEELLKQTGLFDCLRFVGQVITQPMIFYRDMELPLEQALVSWKAPLEKVFPSRATENQEPVVSPLYEGKQIYVNPHKIARPRVFIPVFPGTNCEIDSAEAFERAGADPIVRVFCNRNAQDIRDSVEVFAEALDQAQIVMFPGGFSAGDEPEGSAKFFATAFRNEKIKEAMQDLLNKRDGLALGICNGFQALIKLGLVPQGQISEQKEDAPTLTYNTIGRHISKEAYIKVVSKKSPWLAQAELGGVYTNPASHGEGRFVASKEWLDALFANGQVAFQYCDAEGNVSMDEEYNINGSYQAIEGISSPDGRVLGKMCHSERIGQGVAINIFGEQDLKLFESGVAYFQ